MRSGHVSELLNSVGWPAITQKYSILILTANFLSECSTIFKDLVSDLEKYSAPTGRCKTGPSLWGPRLFSFSWRHSRDPEYDLPMQNLSSALIPQISLDLFRRLVQPFPRFRGNFIDQVIDQKKWLAKPIYDLADYIVKPAPTNLIRI